MLTFIAYGFVSVGQLLMLAHFGDSVEQAGNDMSTAFYNNDWTSCDSKYKKNLILMMISANYPVKLRAGGIFDINLPTFLFVGIELLQYQNYSLFLFSDHQNVLFVVQRFHQFEVNKF